MTQDSSSSPDLSDLGFEPVSTPSPGGGGGDLFSDLGGKLTSTPSPQASPDYSKPQGTPATDQASSSSESTLHRLLFNPESAKGLRSSIQDLFYGIPQMALDFGKGALATQRFTSGMPQEQSKALMDFTSQGIGMGKGIAQGIQSIPGSKEWWDAAAQIGMMATPAGELIPRGIRMLSPPPRPGLPRVVAVPRNVLRPGVPPIEDVFKPEQFTPPGLFSETARVEPGLPGPPIPSPGTELTPRTEFVTAARGGEGLEKPPVQKPPVQEEPVPTTAEAPVEKATPEQIEIAQNRLKQAKEEVEILNQMGTKVPDYKVKEIANLEDIVAGRKLPEPSPGMPESSKAGAIKRAEEMYAATGGYGKGSPLGEFPPGEEPPKPVVEAPKEEAGTEAARLLEVNKEIKDAYDRNEPPSINLTRERDALVKKINEKTEARTAEAVEPGKSTEKPDDPWAGFPEDQKAVLTEIEALRGRWADINQELLRLIETKGKGIKSQIHALEEEQRSIGEQHHELLTQLPEGTVLDVGVIGGGPGTFGAAINGPLEGVNVSAHAKDIGGAPRNTSRIENAMGGPTAGETGHHRWVNNFRKALRAGARFFEKQTVVSMEPDAQTGVWTVHLSDGTSFKRRAVIAATGQTFRRPRFEGKELVHVGNGKAMMDEANGGPVLVYGGSNASTQAATRAGVEGNPVVVMTRHKMTPSDYQVRQLQSEQRRNPGNFVVIEGDEIHKVEAEPGGWKKVTTTKGRVFRVKSIGTFMGGTPATDYLPGNVLTSNGISLAEERARIASGEKLQKGSIRTTNKHEALQHVPRVDEQGNPVIDKNTGQQFIDEKPIPGLYIAGDMRETALQRIGASEAEGQRAITFAAQYIEQLRKEGKLPAWRTRQLENYNRFEWSPDLSEKTVGAGTPLSAPFPAATGLPTTPTILTTSSGKTKTTTPLTPKVLPRSQPLTPSTTGVSPSSQSESSQTGTDVRLPSRPGVLPPPPIRQAPVETTTQVAGKQTVEFPMDRITLSKDVPQFKSGANEKGVVEPLAGKYERTGTAPVQLWERLNGETELISGRHRFDLAQRTGERTIPSQIHREADGFNAAAAARLDAELNIRDEKGSVGDYANYFRNSELSQADADARGLLARGKGQAGFTIARDGSPDLFALHQSGRLTDAQAHEISAAAPRNPGAQQVGIKAALEGKPAHLASNMVKAALGRAAGRPQTGDLFHFDDTAMRQMEKQAKRATKIQRGIRQQIAAVQGAARNPALAARLGVDVKDPVGVQRRVAQLKNELARWDNWPMHSDLVAITHEGEFGPETPPLPMKAGVPGYEKSPEQLDMDLGRAADKGSELIPNAAPGEDHIQMGMNKVQIANLLSRSMYDKPILEVSTKELLQNALDTSREAGATAANPKRIYLDYDTDNRTITVKDFGMGMTPDTIQKAFFTIGGTKKTGSPENTSGGLGVAKMAFQLGSERIKLVTVKDGLKSTVDVSSKEIAATLEEGSKATIRVLKEKTNEQNGTTVTVKIPESYVDKNGETQPIYFHTLPDFLDKPLMAPVEIVKNGTVLPLGVHQEGWQKDNTFNFSWGKINAYVKPGERTDYPRFNVLSAGLHQFDIHGSDVYGFGTENPKIPYHFTLDVRPNVRGDSPAYPFNNQREGFRSTIKKDVEAMFNYFRKQAVEQQLLEARDVFKDLKQLPEIDPTKSLTKEQIERINAASVATPKLAPPTTKKITSVDIGKDKIVTHYSGGDTVSVTPEDYVKASFKPEREIDFEKTKLDVTNLDPTKPYLHNNTSAQYGDIPGGAEFETKIGNALIKYMREFGKVGGSYKDLVKTDTSGWFGGVSYDKSYRGLNTINPFKAIWINPGGLSHYATVSPKAAAAETIHLFNHEITHVSARNEGAGFTAEMATNEARIAAHGVPEEKFRQILENIYAEHWDAFNEINRRHQDYNTKNRAESFKSSAALGTEQPEGAEIPGERVSSFHAQGDVRVQRQGPTGTGRAGEADRKTGSLGDVLRGSPTDEAGAAGAASAARRVRGPVPEKETEPPRGPIGWEEALSLGKDWLVKGGDPNQVIRDFQRTGRVTTADMGKARAHLNDLESITNQVGDELVKHPKDPGLLKRFNEALDTEEKFSGQYRPMEAVARETLPVLGGHAPLDPLSATSFTGLMRRFKELRGRDPMVTEEARAKTIAAKTKKQQAEYLKDNADVYNAIDREFGRIKSDRKGPPTLDWITKVKEVCG